MTTCIAYVPDGTRCRRPATMLDSRRGGMVCVLHAPDPDARPLHPVTGEEMEYSLAPYIEILAEAETTDDERWAQVQVAARLGGDRI